MNIDKTRFPLTADGYEYRVVATDLGGELPIAIFANGEIWRLTTDLICTRNEGMSLAEARKEHTRYFNVYRAADGSFCLGSKSFSTNSERCYTRDSQRAIAGLRLTYNENSGDITATAV